MYEYARTQARQHTHTTNNGTSGSFKNVSCCIINLKKKKLLPLNFLDGYYVHRKFVVLFDNVFRFRSVFDFRLSL